MRFPILMYHHIRPVPPATDPLRGLSVDPATFARQMRLLKRLGYQGLSMRDLQPYLTSEHGREPNAIPRRVFGITFDDGYSNVLTNAMPVLNELGFTATCYFVAGRLGGENDWDAHLPTERARLMYREELLTWMRHGHEVGSHTVDHVSLPDVSAQAAAQQIVDAKRRLEDICNVRVASFCYPYGNVNRQVRDLVERAGYGNATTTRRGRVSAHDDPFMLARITVAAGVGPYRLLYKCLTVA